MSISEDATTPGAFTGTTASGTLTVTTSAFSPPSASLVVAVVSVGHGAASASVTVTDSGSHSWNTGPTVEGTDTWAGIYWVYLSGGASGITVSAKNNTSEGQAIQLDVRVLDGAASSQSGAGSNTATGTSTTWEGNVTTTVANSWVYIAGCGNAERTVTAESSTTTLNNYQASGGSSCLSGRQSSGSGTVTPGSTSFGWTTNSTAVAYAWAALEILAAAGSVSGSAADNASATGKAQGSSGGSGKGYASATGKGAGTKKSGGSGKGYASATGKAAAAHPAVVNQWANSYGQGTTFTSLTSAFQSCVVPLNGTYSVGGGSGVPTAGNWLFVLASWTQDPSIAEVHVGTGDDVRSWYRDYPASSISGNTRTSISYTPNLARAPQDVYVAPDGGVAAMTVLVVEVSGLGPWDTVASGGPDTNYAAASESLSLSLGSPAAASFFIGAAGGDSTAAGQAFAPAGWATLHTVSQSNGTNQLASNYLTSAFLSSSSSSQSVSATATSDTDLSGFLIGVYVNGTSPVPANSNPDWPHVVFEAGFGSGFNTPDSEVTWTDLSSRIWNWDETTGIQFQLGQLQSTDMSVELDNWDGNLSPKNAASPYAGLMVPGTPLRLRMAFGTIGGITVNRWYVIQRNAGEWNERITDDFRRYIYLTGTDIWASLSETPPTFYRSEVYEDSPYAWWPLDDQPGTANVLPTSFLNAATGNTNTLNAFISPSGGVVESAYSAGGFNATYLVSGAGLYHPGVPPSAGIYQAGTNAGWMFGDPQSTTAAIEAGTGNPVSATPGSASWQTSGQTGTTGSGGFFLSCNDNNFPGLSGGVTAEIWFKAPYYGSGTGWLVWNIPPDTYNYTSVLGEPYNTPLTIWGIATGSHPVCKLQLSAGTPGNGGALNLITYNGATATSHSIYSATDLRDNSWHMATVTMTTTTWQVWLDGGANANVSGTATGMTSAWTWVVFNGDFGANGGSPAGTGLVNNGNIALSHAAIYPVQLPYYRVLDHYWAAVTAFGQLPAPQAVQISWVNKLAWPQSTSPTAEAEQSGYTLDGTIGGAVTTGDVTLGNPEGGYSAETGVGMTAVVTAVEPVSGTTSGPSAWVSSGNVFYQELATDVTISTSWPCVQWTGVAPRFNVYTAQSTGSELEAAVVAGDSESFASGYGGSASGAGVSHYAGGNGSSPPTAASSIGDTVGQRIERLMRAGKATSPNRCIDPDPLLVQAPGSAGGGVQAGAAIQAIQQSTSGFLAVDNLNNLFLWDRSHLASQYNNPVWALGPTTSEGHIPYHLEIRWPTDPQRVWNAITVTPFSPTGASLPEYTPTNSSGVLASQAQYGAQPYAVTSWLQSTSEMQAQANWVFEFFGVPQRRAEDVKVDAAPYPAAWPLVAAIGVGDVITIEDWQIGGGGTNYTFRVTELKRRLAFGARGDQVEAYVSITADFEPTSYWS